MQVAASGETIEEDGVEVKEFKEVAIASTRLLEKPEDTDCFSSGSALTPQPQ